MISNLQPELETARAPASQRYATCPLCHTIEMSLSDDALAAGGEWQCIICGQRWDAPRLATAAAYAVWAVQREAVSKGEAPGVNR
jgi:transcription elongation factor Elf1